MLNARERSSISRYPRSPGTAAHSGNELAQQMRYQLQQQLVQRLTSRFIAIGFPFHFFINLLLWRDVFVVHRFVPAVYWNNLAVLILSYGGGAILLHYRYMRAALAVIILCSEIPLLLQIWLMGQQEAFIFAFLPLGVPALVLSARLVLGTLALMDGAFTALVLLNPQLRTAPDWLTIHGTLLVIVSVFVVALVEVGLVFRRVHDDFFEASMAREEEAVRRARLEEHTKALEEHQQRLLAAQHDLRAPANTLLRTVQLVQAGAFDGPTARALLPQIELLVTRLRTRMDALFDEAKAPRLGARRDLPEIDLSSVIAAHLPELRRQAALAATVQTPDRQPAILFEPCGPGCPIHAREDELQRILENLVLNSVAAGSRQIRLLLQPDGGDVVVIVEDTGKGFPEWMLQAPFRTMYSENKGGAGLGLSGVKANVEAFHGTLTLENWEEGARVRVSFPCASQAGPA